MPKFMVLYRAEISVQEQMANATPEQRQAGMEEWMAWAAKAGSAIVDLGSPLCPMAHLGATTGAASDVCGYSVLEGESADALRAVLDGHPHLVWGGSLDVLELLVIPGMG